jgi:ribulose-5-phosphate 4-epimerase/fuculose-1-phosphate aldolase
VSAAERERIVEIGVSLFERGLTHGRTGNLSVRTGDQVILTPTGASLGRLTASALSVVDMDGRHLDGAPPTKELGLHLGFYRARPADRAVVHLHSTWATAVACLRDVDPEDVLPPLTAYYVMRVGRLPLVSYYPPGHAELAQAVADRARQDHALLLANHGPIVSGADLDAAADCVEELEQTARIFLALGDRPIRLAGR